MARRGSYAKGVAKREEILSTALEVIATHGYRRASVRELADAVGLSQAGLLHYFDSKEELFTEVLRKRDEVDAATLTNAQSLEDADPSEMLADFLRVMRHNSEVPGLVHLHAALSAEAGDAGHPAHTFFAQRYVSMRRLLANAIRLQQARGTMRPDLDAEAFAITLIAIADGLQVQWSHEPTLDMAAHIEGILALVAVPGAEMTTAATAAATTPALG